MTEPGRDEIIVNLNGDIKEAIISPLPSTPVAQTRFAAGEFRARHDIVVPPAPPPKYRQIEAELNRVLEAKREIKVHRILSPNKYIKSSSVSYLVFHTHRAQGITLCGAG